MLSSVKEAQVSLFLVGAYAKLQPINGPKSCSLCISNLHPKRFKASIQSASKPPSKTLQSLYPKRFKASILSACLTCAIHEVFWMEISPPPPLLRTPNESVCLGVSSCTARAFSFSGPAMLSVLELLQCRNSGCRVNREFASKLVEFGTKMMPKQSTLQNRKV
jgi:hypothetical protein